METTAAADRIAAVRRGQLVRRRASAPAETAYVGTKNGAGAQLHAQHVARMLDSAKVAAVKKVLRMMGTATAEMAKPAYAPRQLCDLVDYVSRPPRTPRPAEAAHCRWALFSR